MAKKEIPEAPDKVVTTRLCAPLGTGSIGVSSGRLYHPDKAGVIEADPDDVGDLLRFGCFLPKD